MLVPYNSLHSKLDTELSPTHAVAIDIYCCCSRHFFLANNSRISARERCTKQISLKTLPVVTHLHNAVRVYDECSMVPR